MRNLIDEINGQDFPDKVKHLGKYIKEIKAQIGNEDPERLQLAVRLLIDPQLSFTQLQMLHRVLTDIETFYTEPKKGLKVSILGSSNLHQMAWLVKLFLFYFGIEAEIHQGSYGDYAREILDQNSGLYQFKPDIILLLTDHRDIGSDLQMVESLERADELIERELQAWFKLWSAIEKQLKCIVVQNNFDYFPENALGNLSFSTPFSPNSLVDLLNLKIIQMKPTWLYFHDLRNLVNDIGKRKWHDRRYYYHSKQGCSLEVLPEYGYSLTSIVNAIYGKQKKCLVLDADNTLWGGLIGDDGMEGIEIGQGSALGEAYLDFQRYVLSLKKRGVLLAICTKNESDLAQEPFENHPDMLMKLNDIVCFVANWQDKASNLKTIAKTLNIGIDAMVFIDDNPSERMLVRKFLPEVAVPYMPTDPSEFVPALECYRFFESVSLTREDLVKTEQYKSEEKRQELLASSDNNLDEFLRQLDIKGNITEFNAVDLSRIHQLLNKTNQFNLTGKRYTISELEQIMNDRTSIGLSVRAKDKFGDYGLVSVLIAIKNDTWMDITSWVMSCRVFSRGIEKYLFNRLYEMVREKGIKKIRGSYVPTERNIIVESLYVDLGLNPVEGNDYEYRTFEGIISNSWMPFKTFVREDSVK